MDKKFSSWVKWDDKFLVWNTEVSIIFLSPTRLCKKYINDEGKSVEDMQSGHQL